MPQSKILTTVVEDIYNKISVLGQGETIEVCDKDLDKFAEFMKQALKDWLTPRGNKKPSLRMSNIGRPDRQLWFDMNSDRQSKGIPPQVLIKFLYGHILERVLLFLTELSGHKVTDEQKEVTVNGIVGHMDCKIDGEVVDIKSASGYAFKKFKDGTLVEDDPFGYIAQHAGYEHGEGTSNGGLLVINKETGELTLFIPQELDKPDIPVRIDKIKKMIKLKTLPDFCYIPVPEGSSGNFKLPRKCHYCIHKFECHKDSNDGKGLRVFKYAKGLMHLTTVVREPKVEEVLNG